MPKGTTIAKYTVLIGVLFVLPLSLVLLFAKGSVGHFYTLPYFDPDPKYAPSYSYTPPVDSVVDHTQFHSLPNFELTSHKGLPFTKDSLENAVWMVAFFGLNDNYAKKATEQLLWVNYHYRNESDIKVLCLSLDADNDNPEKMATYVEQNVKYNAFGNKWYFLTGNQSDIDELIHDGFMLHETENLATMCVMDGFGHIRGRYNGNLKEDIKKSISDMALLKKELDKR